MYRKSAGFRSVAAKPVCLTDATDHTDCFPFAAAVSARAAHVRIRDHPPFTAYLAGLLFYS